MRASGQGDISSPTLVGRDSELALLRAGLEDAQRGRPTVTLLIGDAGVGKTRLIREAEAIAVADGFLALHGDCLELSVGELPYAPIAAALRDAEPSALAGALAALPHPARRELARAFPDIVEEEPATTSPDDAFGQSRLFGWILTLLRGLTAIAPVMLTIEDLHCADASSRDFLRFLVQSARSERAYVIASLRRDELAPEHPARALLAELSRSARVTRHDLAPLSRDAVREQIAQILSGPPPAALVGELFARGEGNPFYTEELMASGSRADGLPRSLRDALLLRFVALSEPARRLARLVAIAGRPIDHAVLYAASGLDPRAADAALREGIGHNIVVGDRRRDRYAVRHALLREAITEDLLPAERSTLHGMVAAALAETPSLAAERARHWELAGEPARALQATIEAALAAETVFGYPEALAHFRRALRLWRDGAGAAPLALDHVQLHARAAQAARWTGESALAVELCQAALGLVEGERDPVRAARLYERLGRYQPWNVERSLNCYARALELLPLERTRERMRLYVDEAMAFSFQGQWTRALERAGDAIDLADGDRTVAVESAARGVLGVAIAFLGDPAGGEAHLRCALELATRADSVEDLAQIRLDLAEVLRLEGRIEEALGVMLDGEVRAAGVGAAGSYGNFMAVNAADDLWRLGRWDELEARLEALAERSLDRPSQLLLDSVAGRLDTARGRLEHARARLQLAAEACEALDLPEFVPAVHSGYAELELWGDDPLAARARIAAGLAMLAGSGNLLHLPWLYSTGARVEADAAELGRQRRDAVAVHAAVDGAERHHQALERACEQPGADAGARRRRPISRSAQPSSPAPAVIGIRGSGARRPPAGAPTTTGTWSPTPPIA